MARLDNFESLGGGGGAVEGWRGGAQTIRESNSAIGGRLQDQLYGERSRSSRLILNFNIKSGYKIASQRMNIVYSLYYI